MDIFQNKFFQFPIVKMVIGITFCLAMMAFSKIYITEPILYKLFSDHGIADIIKNCFSFSTLLFSYFLFSKFYEGKKTVELSVKKLPKELFGGLGIGFLTISLSILILYFLGYYEIISISTEKYSLQLFTLLLTAALVEDLLIRGLMIRILENWQGTYIALAFGIIFESMHLFNPNVTFLSAISVLIWGFTMTMFYIYSKRVWLPFFFHVGWNFAQPFYGSNLTGVEDMGVIIESKFIGPEIFTGGNVGIEESIFTMIFLLVIGATFFYFAKKGGKFIPRKKALALRKP